MTFSLPLLLIKLKGLLKNSLNQIGYEIRGSHVNAFQDQKKILESFTQVKTILDLGANIGQTTDKYHAIFPEANIYAFEPYEKDFRVLAEQHQNNKNIKAYQLAVSEKTGQDKFFVSRFSVMNSLLPVAESSSNYLATYQSEKVDDVEVNTISLDDFCQKEQIEHINILKMDIQGGEILALQGATNLLSRKAIDLVYSEVMFGKMYENQSDFYQISNILFQYGYVLYGLYNSHYGSNGVLGWGDAIFISSQIETNLPKSW